MKIQGAARRAEIGRSVDLRISYEWSYVVEGKKRDFGFGFETKSNYLSYLGLGIWNIPCL